MTENQQTSLCERDDSALQWQHFSFALLIFQMCATTQKRQDLFKIE